MSTEIKIDPAKVLGRIIANLAAECRVRRSKRGKQRPLWVDISSLTGHGCGYSTHIVQMYGFNADTGEQT